MAIKKRRPISGIAVAQLRRRVTETAVMPKPQLLSFPAPSRRTTPRQRRKTDGRRGCGLPVAVLAMAMIWLSWARATDGLVAYDCDKKTTNAAVIDLTEPAPCPEAQEDYGPEEVMKIQLLMTNGPIKVTAHSCQIYITEKVTRCGWNHRTSGGSTPVPRTMLVISEEQCQLAIESKEFIRDKQAFKFSLGHPRSVSYFSDGSSDTDGNCQWVPMLTSGGKTFTWHYREIILEMLFKEQPAKWDIDAGTVKLASGLRFPDALTTTFDSEKGRFIWTKPDQPRCADELSEIYRGDTQFRPYTKSQTFTKGLHQSEDLTKSVAMVSGETSLRSINRLGIYYGEPVSQCGRSCHKITNMPQFIACPYYDSPQFPEVRFRPETITDHMLMQMDTKSLSDLQHISTNLRMERKLADVIQDSCQLERRQQKTQLAAITNGNAYALAHEFGEGHLMTPAQSVAYVRKCRPVTVHRVVPNMVNCTLELPVRTGDAPEEEKGSSPVGPIRFMNTVSRILNKFPTIIPCSRETPALWKDDAGDWHTVDPQAHVTQVPQQIRQQTQTYKFDKSFLGELGPNGLLTKGQFDDYVTIEDLAQYRSASVDAVTLRKLENAKYDEGTGSSLGGIVSEKDFQEATEYTMRWMTPDFLYKLFGPTLMHAFTYISILSLLLFLLGVVLRWFYQWAYIGWDGGRILGHMAMACCGLLELPAHYLKGVFKLGRDGVGMASSAIGPLLELAEEWKKNKASGNDDENPDADGEPGAYTIQHPDEDETPIKETKDSRTKRILKAGKNATAAALQQASNRLQSGLAVEPLQMQPMPQPETAFQDFQH